MRISREQMFMGVARVVSMRSTCCRLNVGAVVVGPERSILGIGYNGSRPGMPHCGGPNCQWFTPDGCQVVHAEANAIDRAPKVKDSSLYVTHSPCEACASLIAHLGPIFTTVYYETEYRITRGVDALIASGIRVFRLLPSGYLIDKRSGEMREV